MSLRRQFSTRGSLANPGPLSGSRVTALQTDFQQVDGHSGNNRHRPYPVPNFRSAVGHGLSQASENRSSIGCGEEETAACNSSPAPAGNGTAPVPVVTAVTATTDLGWNSESLAAYVRAKGFQPYPAVDKAFCMKLAGNETTILIFPNGRVVFSKATSESLCLDAAVKFVIQLKRDTGVSVTLRNFKVRCLKASCQLGFDIRLAALAKFAPAGSGCLYEPELMEELVYRMEDPVVAQFTVSPDGAVTIEGPATQDQLQAAFEKMYKILLLFKKP